MKLGATNRMWVNIFPDKWLALNDRIEVALGTCPRWPVLALWGLGDPGADALMALPEENYWYMDATYKVGGWEAVQVLFDELVGNTD